MPNFLKYRKIWKYLFTKIEKPTDPAMEEESEYNIGKTKSWPVNFVDPINWFQLARFSHPKDAWDYLARIYVQTNPAKRYQLERKILKCSTRQSFDTGVLF